MNVRPSRAKVARALGLAGPGGRNTVAHIEKAAIGKLVSGLASAGWPAAEVREALRAGSLAHGEGPTLAECRFVRESGPREPVRAPRPPSA